MKKYIVIIEGAKYMRSRISILQSCILLFYRFFNVKPIYSGEHEKWLKLIEKKDREILYFNWSGSIAPRRIHTTTGDFLKFLSDKPGAIIIATSLGAEIALEATEHNHTIAKIISLSGVYRPRITRIPFVDIYSTADRFAQFFRGILRFFSLHEKMSRREIVLHNIRHDQFRDNTPLECEQFENKNMAWLINHFIDNA